jgi:hypothetical protein
LEGAPWWAPTPSTAWSSFCVNPESLFPWPHRWMEPKLIQVGRAYLYSIVDSGTMTIVMVPTGTCSVTGLTQVADWACLMNLFLYLHWLLKSYFSTCIRIDSFKKTSSNMTLAPYCLCHFSWLYAWYDFSLIHFGSQVLRVELIAPLISILYNHHWSI